MGNRNDATDCFYPLVVLLDFGFRLDELFVVFLICGEGGQVVPMACVSGEHNTCHINISDWLTRSRVMLIGSNKQLAILLDFVTFLKRRFLF